MDEMNEKLGAILSNPQMMQQIMSMAQALGQSAPPPPEPPRPDPPPTAPAFSAPMDTAMLQRVFQLAQRSGIDKNQQALLKALGPYLTPGRIVKLEKAMRAAKIAAMAGTVLGSSGITLFSGR
ncbi:MAG: hypothetical protein E7436_06145 [Ruminococcaceae bacterium]|nr:hypothetical protein [Oscillospiraceae bacterium]